MGGLSDASKPKPSSCDGEESWCTPVVPYAPPSPYAPPPPPLASHGRRTFATALIISGSVLAFLTICISIFFFVRRRRLRRRREALLEAALAAPAAPGAFPDDGDGPGDEVVHHAWHIRTVGLDEAAIESIALAPYRAGGALGASDCTVCLGEFQDGELLRLLPKCAHAFHVQCIDTWLRAHVSCPLCRADVVGTAAEQPDNDPAGPVAVAGASAQQSASNGAVEQEQPDQRGNDEQQDPRVHVQSDRPDHSGSPERPHRHTGAPPQNFRRVASMDSPLPAASAEEALPEHDHAADGEKPRTGGAVCCEVSPAGSGHLMGRPAMKRSLSAGSRWRWTSRHCRHRSSLLPF